MLFYVYMAIAYYNKTLPVFIHTLVAFDLYKPVRF